ncbi:MAG: hypothetical protein KF884_11530 [Fimbriimonadaceae bacterium]|nr:hypothetical protein [Fimbriimonadaceae bacterium]QYK58173.1 MAG: hypothetical protein KF884_11530 [Fimbriimonadaceae bacterium]
MMNTQSRILTFLILASASLPCQAQQVDTPAQARRILAEFFAQVGVGYDPANHACQLEQVSPSGRKAWRLGDDGYFGASVHPTKGIVISFSDHQVSARVIAGDYGKQRELTTDEQVWTKAEAVLRAASQKAGSYKRATIFWSEFNGPGLTDPNNYGTRVSAKFHEKVEGFDGFVNHATVTFDTVTGNLYLFSCSVSWEFVPPARVMDKAKAVETARRHLAGLYAEEAARGFGAEAAWVWPGDEEMNRVLKLGITRGGNASPILGSSAGMDNARRYIARASYSYSTKYGVLAFDAETGEPLFASRTQRRPSRTPERESSSAPGSIDEPRNPNPVGGPNNRLASAMTIGGATLLGTVALLVWRRSRSRHI